MPREQHKIQIRYYPMGPTIAEQLAGQGFKANESTMNAWQKSLAKIHNLYQDEILTKYASLAAEARLERLIRKSVVPL